MKIRAIRLCVQTSVWVLASAFCVASLTGCGANGNFTSSLGSDTPTSGISGRVHGGPNPVSGATVTLYATTTENSPTSANNYGYGEAGTALGSTTTAADGTFALSGDAMNCPAGQQAYIVASGGNTTGNTANSAALLMAALGACSGISDSTRVIIDEPTTIAAAYALSGFMTVAGDGVTVNISAPANNNAATGACTTNSTTHATTGCTGAGLAHAFLNAANLVNTSTGDANAVLPTNANAIAPQALIYTLANSVEACVNSSGDTTTPTAPCAILMNNSVPAYAPLATPTNTLQALLDLAQYPSEATGCSTAPTTLCAPGTGSGAPTQNTTVGGTVPSAATTNLYDVANSNAYYTPSLTAPPLDFTIGIAYPISGGGSGWGIASDMNDNIYAYLTSIDSISMLSSDGAQGWTTAISTSPGCGSFGYRCSLSHDTLGNLWVVDSSGVTKLTDAGVLGTTIATSGGTKLESGTVDVGNNLWLAIQTVGTQTGASGLEELVQGTSAIADVNVGGVPEPYASKEPVFDSAGNLWVESDNTGGSGGPGATLFVSSNNSLTSPSFATTGITNPVYKPGGDATPGNDPLIDPSGNLWFSAQDDMLEVPSTGGEVGAQNYGSLTIEYGPIYEAGVERNGAMDGDGNLIINATSTGAGYLSIYYPNVLPDGLFTASSTVGDTGADVYVNPCFIQNIATQTPTCAALAGGQSPLVNNPRATVIDATGAIWTNFQSSGYILQLLGPGAPTWSQKSWEPAALAPNKSGTATSLRPF